MTCHLAVWCALLERIDNVARNILIIRDELNTNTWTIVERASRELRNEIIAWTICGETFESYTRDQKRSKVPDIPYLDNSTIEFPDRENLGFLYFCANMLPYERKPGFSLRFFC